MNCGGLVGIESAQLLHCVSYTLCVIGHIVVFFILSLYV